MNTAQQSEPSRSFYNKQNRTIHKARAQLCLSLDDCRELARQINGKASISSLNLRQRWELIEELKVKGARVYNLPLSKIYEESAPKEDQTKADEVYPLRLAYWEKRFPRTRPGFASNKQLAWIEALWELDFNDGRAGSSIRGLRGFIFRQTRNLENGPVSDPAFLREGHVQAVLMPLRQRGKPTNETEKRDDTDLDAGSKL